MFLSINGHAPCSCEFLQKRKNKIYAKISCSAVFRSTKENIMNKGSHCNVSLSLYLMPYFFHQSRFFLNTLLSYHNLNKKITAVCTESLKIFYDDKKSVIEKINSPLQQGTIPTCGKPVVDRFEMLHGSLLDAPVLSQWEIWQVLTRNILSVKKYHSYFAKNTLFAVNAQFITSIIVNQRDETIELQRKSQRQAKKKPLNKREKDYRKGSGMQHSNQF